MSLLTTISLTCRFAGLVAVDAVDIAVAPGTIHAVIGPNGAGKTTLFNLLSGLVTPTSGKIIFDGNDITHQPVHARAGLGIARSFQNIRIFGAMTVLENVLTGLHATFTIGLPSIVARLPGFLREEKKAMDRALTALDLVGLSGVSEKLAGALPYGDQRRLEIARAMAALPRLLLLDEPAAGMNPAETFHLAGLVRRIRDAGTTVLLVEHDMGFVMEISDAVTVLNFGRRIFAGAPAAIRNEPVVIEAYLGQKMAAKLAARHAAG
jgi:branched-chain amino acid transport system ATP-binding protein